MSGMRSFAVPRDMSSVDRDELRRTPQSWNPSRSKRLETRRSRAPGPRMKTRRRILVGFPAWDSGSFWLSSKASKTGSLSRCERTGNGMGRKGTGWDREGLMKMHAGCLKGSGITPMREIPSAADGEEYDRYIIGKVVKDDAGMST